MTSNARRSTSDHSGGTLTLIVGGVRSGKSRLAQDLAFRLGGTNVCFVATASALDGEMRRRIDRHRRERPAGWSTLEADRCVVDKIVDGHRDESVVLVDCLTLWVSNWLLHRWDESTSEISDPDTEPLMRELNRLADWARDRLVHVVVVSGEVGMGVVPESSLGRQFRDLLGMANQTLGRLADRTFLMVAGSAIPIDTLARSTEQIAGDLQTSRCV